MMAERDVVDRLTNLYREIDDAIPELPPSWRPDSHRRLSRQSWPIQLLATAALLVIVIGGAVLIKEARLRPSPAPVTSPSPQSTSPSLVSLSNWVRPMGLLTDRDGWVVSGNALNVTRDGGTTWRAITPPAYSCCAVFFLDAAHGWAAGAYNPGSHAVGTLKIFGTVDGGATWKQLDGAGPASLACCPTLDFVDPQHGWLAYQDNDASGGPVGKLLRTTNGGASWSALPTLPAVPVEFHGIFQYMQVRFASSSTGWFVGDDGYGGTQRLYLTVDGGLSWQPQSVPVPGTEAGAVTHLTVPSFLSDKEGVLPVTLNDGHVLLDSTSDGGATWSLGTHLFSRSSPPAAIQGNEAPTFIGNGVTAIALGRELEINSGTGWTSVSPNGIAGVIYSIEFANARVGWALSGRSLCQQQPCITHQVLLLRTTDGGHHWSRVGGAVGSADSAVGASLPMGPLALVVLGALALIGSTVKARSVTIRLRRQRSQQQDAWLDK